MEWYFLFIVLLLPNIMRQLVYLKSYKKTKSFGFCVSPETRKMHEKRFLPWSGILEELGWGTAWVIAWFAGLPWLAFGWVSDALLDCSVAYAWSKGRRKPKSLYYGGRHAFFIREVLLPYVLIGPVLYLLSLNIVFYSLASTIIGVLLWLSI